MNSLACLAMVGILALLVVAFVAQRSGAAVAKRVGAALAAWLLYAGALSYLGVTSLLRPPGPLFIVIPVTAFAVVFIARSGRATALIAAAPAIFIGAQVFRLGVELLLHRLAAERILPQMLTYDGANFDIVIGISAPVFAWVSSRGRLGLRIAQGWNVVGLIVLANVVGRALLTTPGPLHFLHLEVPNRMFATFPFTFVPAFFVPLAVSLHVLALRSIGAKLTASR